MAQCVLPENIQVHGWSEGARLAEQVARLHPGLDPFEDVPLMLEPEVTFKDRSDPFEVGHLLGKIAAVFWEIIYFVLIPIEVVRIVGSWGLLPAVWASRERLDRLRFEQLLDLREKFGATFDYHRRAIATKDGVKLDTFQITHADAPADPREQKWILFFNGNGATYEEMMDQCAAIASDIGANVYMGNYRGVGYSEGWPLSSTHLKLDGQAMLQDLLERGVPLENIVIHGWSMGGAVGAAVAAANPGVHLMSDRTFSSLGDVVTAQCIAWGPRLISGSCRCCSLNFAYGLSAIVSKVASWILQFIGWEFDAVKDYRSVGATRKCIIDHSGDMLMLPSAKLLTALSNAGEVPHDAIHLSGGRGNQPHSAPINMWPQYLTYIQQLKRWLNIAF